jgi:hypothetical protein
LRVATGDLLDWSGHTLPVFREWGFEYDVRPDVEEKDVANHAAARDGARKLLRRLIAGNDWPSEIGQIDGEPNHERLARSLAAGLCTTMTGQLSTYWMDLQALEQVVAVISDELGEDAMDPASRQMADDLARRMHELADKVRLYTPDYVLPEPDEAALTLMRRFVEHAEKDVP